MRRPLRWCGNKSPGGSRAQAEDCTLPTELEEAPRAATTLTGIAQLLVVDFADPRMMIKAGG